MSTLDEIALKHGPDKSSKYHGYTKYYEMFFEPIRNSNLRILEIGVQFGLSIKMWLEYFSASSIFGIDICPIPSQYAFSDPRFKFVLGDHNNTEFWKKFIAENGSGWDIVIDDGSHYANGIVTSFNAMWPNLNSHGFYVVEDLFVAYGEYFQVKGWQNQMEFIKGFMDDINLRGKIFLGNPTPPKDTSLSPLEQEIEYLHFSKGLAIIKKK
jgi:hypothetical protein